MDILHRENLAEGGHGHRRAEHVHGWGRGWRRSASRPLAAPKDTLHPILGSMRHPSTALGNIGLLTSRAVGEPDAMLNLANTAPEA